MTTRQAWCNLCTDCLLTNDRGEAIHSAPEAVKGALESVTVFGDKVQFKGWAADIGVGGPFKVVLIFADDKLVHMGTAEEERYDVAQAGAAAELPLSKANSPFARAGPRL